MLDDNILSLESNFRAQEANGDDILWKKPTQSWADDRAVVSTKSLLTLVTPSYQNYTRSHITFLGMQRSK